MALESPTHDELRELASLYVLGGLTPEERETFEAHLSTCAECAAEVKSLRPVPTAIAQAVPEAEPSPALREKVLGRVKAVSEASQRNVRHVSEVKDSSASAGALVGWLPLAASLALAVGLGVYALQLRARVSDLETRSQNALARADVSERQIADARRASLEAQSQMAVLMAPDVTRVDLAGQPAAPSAQARAFFSPSRGLVFTAANLPPLPEGRTYQLWFVAGDGVKLSAGVFAPDANGSATLTTAAGMPQPAVLAVTLEPAGGVPQPTGAMYVAGNVRS